MSILDMPNKEQKYINLQVQTICKTFEELLQHPPKYSSYKKKGEFNSCSCPSDVRFRTVPQTGVL